MIVRTPSDLGALIRDRRKQLMLRQQELAERIGVSRQWLIDVEKGKPRAEIGLLLRALDVLGVALGTVSDPVSASAAKARSASIDLNAIVAKARRRA